MKPLRSFPGCLHRTGNDSQTSGIGQLSEMPTDGNVLRRPDLGPEGMTEQGCQQASRAAERMFLMRKVLVLLMLSVVSASAGYSKLEALSLIESGNNDAAVGSLGEVSRYQIKPRIWREYSSSRSWRDARVSSQVAETYLKSLEETFLKRAGRAPTDFDLYVLWNAGPAYYAKLGFSAARVHPVVRERAQRYVNLRNVTLAQSPSVRVAAVQPQASTSQTASAPAWTLAQAISMPAQPAGSLFPRSAVSERN